VSLAALIVPMVGELVKAGFVIAAQQQEAIDYLIAHLAPSPPDIAGGYFRDRASVLGDDDEIEMRLPYDTDPLPSKG